MQVRVDVRTSPVHGHGLFATAPIAAGTILWRFRPAWDVRIPREIATPEQLHYGYVNPRRPEWLVECGDEARWWNFATGERQANAVEGPLDAFGEALVIAARHIGAGEELLIDVGTDADAQRKLTTAATAA